MRLPLLVAALLVSAVFVHAPALADEDCGPARLLLVIDQSSSMAERLPGGGTKWDAARTAVGDVSRAFEGALQMGLQVFPHPDACSPGAIVVPVGTESTESFLGALTEPPPRGRYTPMAQTLDAILDHAPMIDDAAARHVVLVTDGWQWCDPHDPATRFAPVDAVTRLRARGIVVHVVGFGAGVDALTLDRAALAAGTAIPGCRPSADPMAADHCYLRVDEGPELTVTLMTVAGAAMGCGAECVDGERRACGAGCARGERTCVGGVWSACEGDSGGEERCEGTDEDCDGRIDEGASCAGGECVAGVCRVDGGALDAGPRDGSTGDGGAGDGGAGDGGAGDGGDEVSTPAEGPEGPPLEGGCACRAASDRGGLMSILLLFVVLGALRRRAQS